MKNIIKEFQKRFTNASIRHLLLGASGSEPYMRNPDNSCGITFRDQGQSDLYAGGTRVVLTEDGTLFNQSVDEIHLAAKLRILLKDIKDFELLGKTLDKEIFNGQQVAVFATDQLESIRLTTAQTTDSQGGQLTNTVSLTSILQPRTLFQAIEKKGTKRTDVYNLVGKALGWKDVGH